MMGIIRPLPIATVYDASIEALCLDSPDQCVELIITALVHNGLTLLQMSQQLEERFPSLLGMTDNARRCEMLNILVAAAHYPGDHTLDIIEAAYRGLSTADNVRQELRSRMDGFMPRIDQLTAGWGSLEDACLGFRRLSIMDVPTQREWVKKYESTLGNIERDLGLCIDHDDTKRVILLMNNCGKRKPHRSALVRLFYTRDDTLAPNTRKLYLGQSEPQAEEVFARILAPSTASTMQAPTSSSSHQAAFPLILWSDMPTCSGTPLPRRWVTASLFSELRLATPLRLPARRRSNKRA
ncbi:hypothetical protein DV532_26545 (plasmid) [Pseudomonas sp. Leaf58]|uniref:hypothetical protein n=1 Tax=Pseudomonas sp. Leaf58 TaxID=1736226 RepID=UPI000EA96015|nr:hypothetical protein [Pseudomonas sp. Leaf58]AYG47846.1 hypothetical protein DV532_26545 [Pseudomonas sp. Leaf58]